jgi:hypothetical protein
LTPHSRSFFDRVSLCGGVRLIGSRRHGMASFLLVCVG